MYTNGLKGIDMNRRDFITAASCFGAAAMAGGFAGCATAPKFTPSGAMYDETVRDRLWLWGHHANALLRKKPVKTFAGLPSRPHTGMLEGCKYLGIPNLAFINWGGGVNMVPDDPDDPFYTRFCELKRTAWKISMGGPENLIPRTEIAFRYQKVTGNLTTCFLDDYFIEEKYVRPLDELTEVRERLHSHDIKLTVVLYTDQGGGIKDSIKPSLDVCDEVSLWFWHGKNVDTMDLQVRKCREFIGKEKSMLLGLYIWDWGAGRPIGEERMRHQLDLARQYLADGTVSGLIFHTNLICDMDDPAVELSRRWIAGHGEEHI